MSAHVYCPATDEDYAILRRVDPTCWNRVNDRCESWAMAAVMELSVPAWLHRFRLSARGLTGDDELAVLDVARGRARA